ncbi:MAG: YlmC/YmxH family sporulation protein [Clostridia bacterium]|nr:YlmC/YmxH family sporulation protein [Clostridia bacterium]
MEMSFSDLKLKEVINTADGRKLGKICDIVFCYPENKILGFIVPGNRSFGVKKTDFFLDLKNIVKIGGDTVLVNVGCPRQNGARPRQAQNTCPAGRFPTVFGEQNAERRSYEEYE